MAGAKYIVVIVGVIIIGLIIHFSMSGTDVMDVSGKVDQAQDGYFEQMAHVLGQQYIVDPQMIDPNSSESVGGQDPWGNEYRIESSETGAFAYHSAGPDGIFDPVTIGVDDVLILPGCFVRLNHPLERIYECMVHSKYTPLVNAMLNCKDENWRSKTHKWAAENDFIIIPGL